MEWTKNTGAKPDEKLVDVMLNCDEADWPGVECIRYSQNPYDWEWTRGIGQCEITHYKVSDCQTDFIPAGEKIFIGVDMAKDSDCMVKGFYDPATGEYHIQEVVHNDLSNRRDGIAGTSELTAGLAGSAKKV